MNAASSVHGQPAWISSTGWCGMALEQVEEACRAGVRDEAVGVAAAGVDVHGHAGGRGHLEGALQQPVAHGLGVPSRLAEAVLAPARERAARIGRARVRDVEPGAVGDHRLEGDGAVRGGRLEARAERVLQLVVALRRVPLLGDPGLDAHDAVDGDARLALELGARDDRQREALVDDQALDARVPPQLLQIPGRVRAQALEARGADRLVAWARSRAARPGARAARAPSACSPSRARALPRTWPDPRPRSARTCRASSPARRSRPPARRADRTSASRAGGCR